MESGSLPGASRFILGASPRRVTSKGCCTAWDISKSPRGISPSCEVSWRVNLLAALDRALASRRNGEFLPPSGSVDLILFSWNLENVAHLLVLALKGTGDETAALALQVGPIDRQSLLLRAGPDSAMLSDKTVTVFGLGALGGHVAVALAQSGITCLRLFDGDLLLPENVVRHAGGHLLVGAPKVEATGALVGDHAPWTEVSASASSPLAPKRTDPGDYKL